MHCDSTKVERQLQRTASAEMLHCCNMHSNSKLVLANTAS